MVETLIQALQSPASYLQANTLLGPGYPVLVDATFIAEKWRRWFDWPALKPKATNEPLGVQNSHSTHKTR